MMTGKSLATATQHPGPTVSSALTEVTVPVITPESRDASTALDVVTAVKEPGVC